MLQTGTQVVLLPDKLDGSTRPHELLDLVAAVLQLEHGLALQGA